MFPPSGGSSFMGLSWRLDISIFKGSLGDSNERPGWRPINFMFPLGQGFCKEIGTESQELE